MSNTSIPASGQFVWEPQPRAWALLLEIVERACQASPSIYQLRRQMLAQTGTRLIDWLETVWVDQEETADGDLLGAGFEFCDAQQAWLHSGGLFPPIRRPDSSVATFRIGLAIGVDDVEQFVNAQQLSHRSAIEGAAFSSFRYTIATNDANHALIAVERRGHCGWKLVADSSQRTSAAMEACERFASRPRPLVDPQPAFATAKDAFDVAANDLGQDWACDLFFLSERNYWQSRNRAAQVQHARQDKLGLGWGNHDHHTYRCSREHFAALIGLLEHMGFDCRESFHAGAQAGWGAQVLEHSQCGFVVFADVDMSAEEVTGDFAHEGLPPREELGTVGLWCKLHGEAIMQAGLHHLECQFDFDQARAQLAQAGIDTMDPFTDFPFLRQAFTVGEQWTVDVEHVRRLRDDHFLTDEQADQFWAQGARGSHLEILERNDGYKGFNQTGISHIIARTDPRNR